MTTVAKLVRTELRLFLREPLVLTFVFAFPVITVLVLIGSFDAQDDGFPVSPAHWYTAGYLAVVVAAIGLVMLPVHLAGYRERGMPPAICSIRLPTLVVRGGRAHRRVARHDGRVGLDARRRGRLHGLPTVDAPLQTAAGLLVGATAFISIGLLLGASHRPRAARKGSVCCCSSPCSSSAAAARHHERWVR